MLMMTEKPENNVPVDEHGYWGGFSPTRVGKYQNQGLTKRFSDGRARIYPARKSQSIFNSQEVKETPPTLGSREMNTNESYRNQHLQNNMNSYKEHEKRLGSYDFEGRNTRDLK